MQLVNWILLFLATLFGYLDSMKATSLSQDTIRDEAYQLYPLGIACRNNDLETIKRLLAGKDEPMAMGKIVMSLIYSIRQSILTKKMC